jgi:hypothetical protein
MLAVRRVRRDQAATTCAVPGGDRATAHATDGSNHQEPRTYNRAEEDDRYPVHAGRKPDHQGDGRAGDDDCDRGDT